MRCSEIMALKWENIQGDKVIISNGSYFVDNKLILSEPKNKNSKRAISIDDEIIKLLEMMKVEQQENKNKYEEFYNDENFVFTKEGGSPLGKGFISTFYRNIREKVSISSPVHAMRHTHATWLIEAGANIKAVQTRLGHSDIKTTLNIYAHVTKKMEDDTLDIIKKF